MPSSAVRRTVVAGLATVLAGGSLIAAAPAATAEEPPPVSPRSATGSAAIGSFNYSWNGLTLKVPAGCFLTHVVKGSGKKITNQYAGADCGGLGAVVTKFCNYRIDFAYADTNGKTYKTSRGKTHTTCKSGGVPLRYNKPQTLPKYGKACARLYVNGKSRAVQCHYIKK